MKFAAKFHLYLIYIVATAFSGSAPKAIASVIKCTKTKVQWDSKLPNSRFIPKVKNPATKSRNTSIDHFVTNAEITI